MSQEQLFDQVETPPSLAEIAFQAIKKAILEKRLVPDVTYNEKVLADELGFSKTPVREALTALSVKGFVTILPRKGFQVRALTVKNIQDMYEFRKTLERAVVEKIVPDITDESIDHLKSMIDRIACTDDPTQLGNLDQEFHNYLASLTGNLYIIEALDNLWELCAWIAVRAMTNDARNHEPMYREHLNIWEGIKARDAERTIHAMDGHLQKAEERWLDQHRSETESE